MPAFTQLCAKVNISLFDNTMTLYPKKTGSKSMQQVFLPFHGVVSMELDCVFEEAQHATAHASELNDRIRYVHRDDACHDLFHQDIFNMNDVHYHMQFPRTIDLSKLRQILTLFTKYQLITHEEQDNFIKAFIIVQQTNAGLDNLSETQNLHSPLFASTKVAFVDPLLIDALFSDNEKQQAFIDQLKIMNEKALSLEAEALANSDYLDASVAARTLCSSLYTSYQAFSKDIKTAQACTTFQMACDNAIFEANDVLKEHRGWGEFCANIGLALATLIFGYLAYATYNKICNNDRFMFFRINTDSGKKLDNLKVAADEMIDSPSVFVY